MRWFASRSCSHAYVGRNNSINVRLKFLADCNSYRYLPHKNLHVMMFFLSPFLSLISLFFSLLLFLFLFFFLFSLALAMVLALFDRLGEPLGALGVSPVNCDGNTSNKLKTLSLMGKSVWVCALRKKCPSPSPHQSSHRNNKEQCILDFFQTEDGSIPRQKGCMG